ncbi:Bug family tripartite tricarboxylate transporter substrate binding protein [Parapusillimonas sp. JC17]|uniref:Bug family tripartite tricarboxylate transporter substrate binding protein n=1 Tax=Parapusillimonas sp. JC17 TaxID=3445768 RepID=UPI003FA0266D
MKTTKFLLSACLGISSLVVAGAAMAADAYPSKPIKVIVGYPAGGANDLVARAIGQEMSKDLGQQVVVENVSGAAGTIGAASAARAAPDGYTLFMAAGAHTLAPSVRKSLPYDIVTDFAPVSVAAIGSYVLVVHPDVKAKSVKELIDLAKASPETMTFASSGVGAPPHLAGVLFQERTGTKLHHIPFRGDADANTAVLAGHVNMIFGSMGPTVPHIRGGKVRALAVTGNTRSAALPDVPTLEEAGVPDYNVSTWWGLLAPAGTPPAIVDKLAKSVEKAAAQPHIKEQFVNMGVEAASNTPTEFAGFIKAEVAKFKRITEAAGIEPQ